MRILAIIPARGGSKSIPRKNLAPLAGKPLIAHTIAAARAASGLTRTIVSTDDTEIAEVASACGVEVPFLRPPELAEDTTPMLGVVQHACDWYEARGETFDAAMLLQPTSPLRRTAHINEALALFHAAHSSSLVSVTEVPHQYNPVSVMTLNHGFLHFFLPETPAATRRQDKPKVYARNGPAILITRVATLRAHTLYGEKILPYVMDSADSLDIDTPPDLAYAAWLFEQSHAQ